MADKFFSARATVWGLLAKYRFMLCGTTGNILVYDDVAKHYVRTNLTRTQVARLKRIANAS
jgi:hypothetical protein